jgi:hypothetical protein
VLGHGPARRARHPEADAGQPGRRAAGKDAPDRGPSLGRDQARSLEFLLTFKVQRDRGPRPRAGRTRPCGAALSCASRPEAGDHDPDIGFPEGNPERRRSCPRSAGRSPCCILCWITDFISAAQLLQQKIGIDLKPEEISHTALMSDIENGNFQLALDNLYGDPTPYR